MGTYLRMHPVAGALLVLLAVPALGWPLACSPASKQAGASGEQHVRITAKRFEYSPAEVHLKRGVPVVLELTSLDHVHGFALTDFGLRSDIPPNEITRLRFVPDRTGRFGFHCDVFCGSGHEDMSGEIVVED